MGGATAVSHGPGSHGCGGGIDARRTFNGLVQPNVAGLAHHGPIAAASRSGIARVGMPALCLVPPSAGAAGYVSRRPAVLIRCGCGRLQEASDILHRWWTALPCWSGSMAGRCGCARARWSRSLMPPNARRGGGVLGLGWWALVRGRAVHDVFVLLAGLRRVDALMSTGDESHRRHCGGRRGVGPEPVGDAARQAQPSPG